MGVEVEAHQHACKTTATFSLVVLYTILQLAAELLCSTFGCLLRKSRKLDLFDKNSWKGAGYSLKETVKQH